MSEKSNPALFDEIMNEFKSTFESCSGGSDVLDLPKFKQLMVKVNDNAKARYGESEKGSEQEDEMWFKAYNMITPGKEGVSLEDMKTGRTIMMTIMKVRYNQANFEPVLEIGMERLYTYKPLT